eukprot:Platyproteum_vivax@DN9711_c0_g1_i1.p1
MEVLDSSIEARRDVMKIAPTASAVMAEHIDHVLTADPTQLPLALRQSPGWSRDRHAIEPRRRQNKLLQAPPPLGPHNHLEVDTEAVMEGYQDRRDGDGRRDGDRDG